MTPRCFRLLLPVLAIAVFVVIPAHAQLYTVTDLGAKSYPGGSLGLGVNDSGEVTGFTTVNPVSDPATGRPQHSFLWTPATNAMTDLGTLGGNSIGYSINANTVIAGTYNDYSFSDISVDADAHPCYWPASSPTAKPLNSLVDLVAPTLHPINPLNTIADVHNQSSATGINNGGWIVGDSDTIQYFSINPSDPNAPGLFDNGPPHACVWTPGNSPQDLGSLYTDYFGNSGDSAAYGVNNYGQIVGETDTNYVTLSGSTVSHACQWNGGAGPIDIDMLSDGSAANSINDVSQVVGYRDFNGVETACVWSPNSGGTWDAQDIKAPAPSNVSTGESINNAGQVVGNGYTLMGFTVSGLHPFLWSPVTKQAKDLNSLIDPASGWTLIEAFSISNTGYITGIGTYKGVTHAFLMKPPFLGVDVSQGSNYADDSEAYQKLKNTDGKQFVIANAWTGFSQKYDTLETV